MDRINRTHIEHSGLVSFWSIQDGLWQSVEVWEEAIKISGYDHTFRTLEQARALHAMLGRALMEVTR